MAKSSGIIMDMDINIIRWPRLGVQTRVKPVIHMLDPFSTFNSLSSLKAIESFSSPIKRLCKLLICVLLTQMQGKSHIQRSSITPSSKYVNEYQFHTYT
ncbi:hypothetical protein QVD17_03568 [Tagetes erecta]|uniref:Uncharacterized protein n=1 Tax=Tagetes erecta TaxID=13708 RepID=A0AAD8LHR5_TARER|nr:hypothetical protein QVD17_03568 [Tagetes erecta]